MGVAEYGGKFGRPHYHFIIFTDGGIDLGKEKRVWSKATSGWKTIFPDSDFAKAWSKDGDSIGHVDISPIFRGSDARKIVQYVVGYIVKKLTNEEAIEREYGDTRKPEFATRSTNPGIGFNSVEGLVEGIKRAGVNPFDASHTKNGRTCDVHMARLDGKLWPVSRGFREKLFKELGDERGKVQRAIDRKRKRENEIRRPDREARLIERVAKERENQARIMKAIRAQKRSDKL
jgi:hypothetical protein